MAYKYKLAEIDSTIFPQAAKAASSTVKSINKGEKISGEQFGELENILREKGIDEDTITDILDTWAERHLFVNPNENMDYGMGKVLNKIKSTDPDSTPDPNAKNTFKTPEELGKARLAKEVLNKLKNR